MRIRSKNKRSFTNIVRLPLEDSGISNSLVRLSNNNIGIKKSQYKRRSPLLITNPKTGRWIVRYAMGNNGSIVGLTKNSLALDYDGINDLGTSYKSQEDLNLVVTKASTIRLIWWLSTSPDQNVRLAMVFALLGFVMGFIGFFT